MDDPNTRPGDFSRRQDAIIADNLHVITNNETWREYIVKTLAELQVGQHFIMEEQNRIRRDLTEHKNEDKAEVINIKQLITNGSVATKENAVWINRAQGALSLVLAATGIIALVKWIATWFVMAKGGQP